MSNIEVGDYVRTIDGIRKIEKINSGTHRTIYGKYILDMPYRNSQSIAEKNILKHSKNIIDLIEDKDFVMLEYKSPKYRERIKRVFEISKIDDYIDFKNAHCNFSCRNGDKKIIDKICKNIKIKKILTHELFEKNCYRLEE